MQVIRLSVFSLVLVCASASAQFAPNAALQGDTLRAWRGQSQRDQIATVTDIVVKILNISDPIAARNKAGNVHACINKVAADYMTGERRVVDVALSCIVQLGYLR